MISEKQIGEILGATGWEKHKNKKYYPGFIIARPSAKDTEETDLA